MRDHRTPEQVIRAIMEGQANAATLEYGTDLARDTYADDTPGQEPGGHTGKHAKVLGHNVPAAIDGIPEKGGMIRKPNPERLAGLGKKESYQGNPYLQMAKQDIIQEDAYDQFVGMSDVEFDDMIDVLTIEELNDLEEGIIKGTGKLIGSAAKGVGKLALGTVKLAGKGIMAGGKAAANRMSTKGRADAAEKKLKKLQQKRKDKERLAKAKQGLKDLKGKPIPISFNNEHKTVQDSHELGSRDYWTETDEQDLTEGKMSKAEVKKHAAAIFKMRQQKQADAAASKALSKPKSAAAKAARRDAADAGYGTPMSDPADRDVRHKPEKRGRGQKDLPHIVSQLRGVVDTKDGAPSQVKFKDGTTKNVKPKHAQAWLNKHDSAKPQQKLDMYKSHDSHKTFKSYAKEAVEEDMSKKCGEGEYWCNKDQKCKPIPKGMKVDKDGILIKEGKKNCGCGKDPCETYGKQEMKEGQRAWDKSSRGRAYRRLSDEEKARLMKKNELMRRAKEMKGDDARYSTSRMRKPTLGSGRQVFKGKKTRREHNEMMEGIILGIEKKFLQEEEKMAGVEYYPRMKAHGKMTDAQKKAVTAVYDKKKVDKKMADDPHVKKAQRYMKVEQAMKGFMESSSWLDQTADTWNDHADHPHPKVQKHIKKAEKAYNEKDYDGFHRHTTMASDHAYSLRQKKKPNVQPKGAMGGPKKINHNPNVKEEVVNELSTDLINKVAAKRRGNMVRAASEYGYTDFRNPNYKEAEKKADRNQRLTMRAGARKIDKFKKSLSKDKEEVNEISDKLKTSYIKRAGQDVSHLEKLKDRKDHVRNVSLDRDDSYGHRVVSKKDADKVITKRRKGMRMATGKLGVKESTFPSKVGTVLKTAAIAKNPKVYATKKVISGVKNVADRITTRVQARRAKRAAVKNMSTAPGTSTTPITNKANQVKHSSQPPKPKPQFEGKMQRQQHLQTTMKPLARALATPLAGPASGAAVAAGALANQKIGKRIAKVPSRIKSNIKGKTSFGPSKIGEGKGLWANIHAKRKRGEKMNPKGHPDAPTSKEMQLAQEASAAEVLKKRYASYHPDDNPQATRKLRDDEHDQPKGANVYKMHPGAKLTDRGYSKKGKMAALKKQHERRPEKYGITRESYAARIAQKMYEEYPPGAEQDMNKLYKPKKDWWKAQDKAKQREDSNKAKLNKINNMGTRHGT